MLGDSFLSMGQTDNAMSPLRTDFKKLNFCLGDSFLSMAHLNDIVIWNIGYNVATISLVETNKIKTEVRIST